MNPYLKGTTVFTKALSFISRTVKNFTKSKETLNRELTASERFLLARKEYLELRGGSAVQNSSLQTTNN